MAVVDWTRRVGFSVSLFVSRLTVGSRQALCVLYVAGLAVSWGLGLGVRYTVQILVREA